MVPGNCFSRPWRLNWRNCWPLTVKIPKVRAKTGEPVIFRSALIPSYVRKTQSLEAALPWLYLKGVSSGEMSGWNGDFGRGVLKRQSRETAPTLGERAKKIPT